jgi:hypothetical protein
MAVTYYNQSVLGGTSAPRYADPLVTGKANSDGLYPWSTFRARLATYDGSVVNTDISGQVSNIYNFLLFTSDVPTYGYAGGGFDPLIPVTAIRPSKQVGSSAALDTPFFKITPGGADVTVSAGQVGLGYVSTGAASPNDYIYAPGFPAVAQAVLSFGGPAEVYVVANGAVISSPVSLQNWSEVTAGTDSPDISGFLPVVLIYSDYTKAIRDAGNIIVNTAAPVGAKYQVVGLYSTYPQNALKVKI